MNEIKFRQQLPNNIHYWGFIKKGVFTPPRLHNDDEYKTARASQQCTGLRDLNGVEIYVGDRVECPAVMSGEYAICEVIIEDGMFTLNCVGGDYEAHWVNRDNKFNLQSTRYAIIKDGD